MSGIIRDLLIAGACALLAAGCASYPAGAPPIDEMDAIQAADDCVCLLAGEELCADGFEVNGGWSEYDRRYRYTYRLWLADDRDHHLDFEVQVSERGRVEVVTRNGRTAPCTLGGNSTRDEFAIRPRRALEIALDAGMGDDEHPIHVTLAWDVIKERALWWVGHRVPARPRPYEDVMVIDSQTGVVVDRYSEPIPEPTGTRLEAAESGAPRVKAPESGLEVPRDAALSHLHAVAMVHTGLVEISFPKDPVTGAPAVSYRANPDLNRAERARGPSRAVIAKRNPRINPGVSGGWAELLHGWKKRWPPGPVRSRRSRRHVEGQRTSFTSRLRRIIEWWSAPTRRAWAVLQRSHGTVGDDGLQENHETPTIPTPGGLCHGNGIDLCRKRCRGRVCRPLRRQGRRALFTEDI
ncbi:MAG: hypothetical protein IPI48_11535 [bacterium]|nr:hypothetical protein [bacterium]